MILAYYAGMNLLALILYGSDKQRARKHKRRIPERVLLAAAALGGALGALAGMLIFHHKTRKPTFRIWVPSLLAAHLVLLLILTGFRYRARPSAFDSMTSDSSVSVRYETNNLVLFTPAHPKAGIIFYPGALVQFEAYAPLLRKCAKKGYACALVRMPLNLALFNGNAAGRIQSFYTGISHWFLAGHSLGGVMAAFYAGDHPDDFDGLILLASYSAEDLSGSGLPVLSVYGSEDTVLNREKYRKYRRNLPPSLKEYVIEGGNHSYFGDYGDQAADGKALISREEQMDETVWQITSFIEGILK